MYVCIRIVYARPNTVLHRCTDPENTNLWRIVVMGRMAVMLGAHMYVYVCIYV